jgi:uncharacterized protein YycO
MLQPGDLLFYVVTPQSSWRARIIAIVEMLRREGSNTVNYSHVSIVDRCTCCQLEAVWPRTRRSMINWNNNIEVWRVKDLNDSQINEALTWANLNLNKPYNLGQLLFGLFTLSNTYSCTQYVSSAFKVVGKDLAYNAGRFIAPNELQTDLIERVQ